MKVSRKKIAAVIISKLDSGMSSKRLSREIAAYLMDAGRVNEVDSLMRDVIALRAESGQVEASVSSAHALPSGTKKEVVALVKSIKPGSKKITLDEKLDLELIGGLKLNIVDQSLDFSVRAKLNKLKQLANQGGI